MTGRMPGGLLQGGVGGAANVEEEKIVSVMKKHAGFEIIFLIFQYATKNCIFTRASFNTCS